MPVLLRAVIAILLLACRTGATAAEEGCDCDRDEIATYARLEFEIYGPLSMEVEYFGFIYHDGDRLRSAVTRSRRCRSGECLIHVEEAGSRIPSGAKVLGEWHTHPHGGAPQLSHHDVRGAHRNRHVRCYTAFYSNPGGQIFAWNPAETSVPTAMASRERVGRYGTGLGDALRVRVASL